jgi:pyrimidine-nucleoside phosphorylase
MIPSWIIEKKRDGNPLTEEEIRFFINGYTDGSIPDYQMAAMAMAIYLKGMNPEEIAVITDAMMRSGDLVDTSGLSRPKVDKHSTGGIGDKVSLVLAPLAACCDLAIPMISGRGLGITGGTLDKLESIPGYRTDLSEKEFLDVVEQCGCSITGQTGQLAPADKKLYALRDVTGTVSSIALITASIMSKKMAAGIDALVLDVKWGSGAFMKTLEDARALALSMVRVGKAMNKGMTALLTDMNQPLGRTAGNALEIRETIESLRNEGPEDLVNITLELTAHMLLLTKRSSSLDEAKSLLREKLASGAALETFRKMVELQGGDPSVIDDPGKLAAASIVEAFPAPQGGYVQSVSAEHIGKACLVLGAGRKKSDDAVDFAVGISDLLKIGESVDAGAPLCTIHANDDAMKQEAIGLLNDAFTFSDTPVTSPALIAETITD